MYPAQVDQQPAEQGLLDHIRQVISDPKPTTSRVTIVVVQDHHIVLLPDPQAHQLRLEELQEVQLQVIKAEVVKALRAIVHPATLPVQEV